MNYDSRNEKMNCVSLKNTAFARIAISLWYHHDIKALISKVCIPSLSPTEKVSVWLNIIEKITEKVPKSLLPESLMRKLSGFIKSIGLEILAWKEYHGYLLSGDAVVIESLNRLCFSSHGKVDKKKTAQILVQDEHLNIICRYELACNYCLEDYIPFLWNNVPEHLRNSFFEDPRKFKKIIYYWTCVVQDETHRLIGIHDQTNTQAQQYLFGLKSAASTGNEVAAEYFWAKLSIEERVNSPVTCELILSLKIDNILRCSFYAVEFPYIEYFHNVRRFFISRMNEAERIRYNTIETLKNEFMTYIINRLHNTV